MHKIEKVLKTYVHSVLSVTFGWLIFIASASGVAADGDLSVSGTVTANTFAGSGAGLTDLPSASLFQSTTLVSPVGTAAENGTALLIALGSIPITPDANNPWLIKIEPGVYDLGSLYISMPEYVDMEGSGENTTIITSDQCGGTLTLPLGVVRGNNHSEIRLLTVKNTGTGYLCAAISNDGVDSARLLNVTASAEGTGQFNVGVYNYQSDSTFINVTASATGASISGSINYGFRNYYSSPTITNSSAIGSNSNKNRGVYNSNSSPTISGSTLTAAGGTQSMGIYNTTNSFPTVSHSTISGESDTEGFGIYNSAVGTGEMFIEHCYIYGSYRFISSGGVNLHINQCRVEGPSMSATDTTCAYTVGC